MHHPIRFPPNTLIHFRCEPTRNNLLKCFIVHELSENLFVLIHPFHKKSLQEVLENKFEFISRIDSCRLFKSLVRDGSFNDLVKEELIRLVKVRPKPIIYNINEPR